MIWSVLYVLVMVMFVKIIWISYGGFVVVFPECCVLWITLIMMGGLMVELWCCVDELCVSGLCVNVLCVNGLCVNGLCVSGLCVNMLCDVWLCVV